MRDILFRGKRHDGVWEYGYYFAKPILEKHFIILGESQWLVKPETVGQYTGLTDKNGKKIFEGDICRVCLDPEICTAHIQYDERTASFNMRYDEYTCNTFLDMRLAENRVGDRVWIEIIGNIHDNPELLEGGAEDG